MDQAKRLFELRRKTGLTLRDVEKEVGVSFARIGAYEKDSTIRIKMPVLEKLAKLYKTTTDYIENGNLSTSTHKAPAQPINPMPPRRIFVGLDNEERIPFVSIPAQAGYLTHFNDEEYLKELPTFSLPGYVNGTYQIFQVAGDSMEPTLKEGDKLITKHVESLEDIKDNEIYVVVSKDGICVKRLRNVIEKRGAVIVNSDNPAYSPDIIKGEDILEVWEYKERITR